MTFAVLIFIVALVLLLMVTSKTARAHFLYFAETYVILPMALVVLVMILHFVSYLTGRPVLDDPGQIAGTMYNAIRIVIAFALVGIGQWLLFGYRSQGPAIQSAPLSDDIHDSVVTYALFIAILYSLSH